MEIASHLTARDILTGLYRLLLMCLPFCQHDCAQPSTIAG
jgi:hypothetical protein